MAQIYYYEFVAYCLESCFIQLCGDIPFSLPWETHIKGGWDTFVEKNGLGYKLMSDRLEFALIT